METLQYGLGPKHGSLSWSTCILLFYTEGTGPAPPEVDCLDWDPGPLLSGEERQCGLIEKAGSLVQVKMC